MEETSVAGQILSTPMIAAEVASPIWRRIIAYILDKFIVDFLLLIIGIPFFVITLFLSFVITEPGLLNEVGTILELGMALLMGFTVFFYFTYYHSRKGSTFGKKWLGIKVVHADTGLFISMPRAFLRQLLAFFTWPISIFVGVFRKDKRTLHDLICRTRVVFREPTQTGAVVAVVAAICVTVFLLLVFSILLIAVLPQFIDVPTQADTSFSNPSAAPAEMYNMETEPSLAMDSVVGAVREGIQLYRASELAAKGTATYPPALDDAANGPCSSTNPCFNTVVEPGVTDGTWTRNSDTQYTYSSGPATRQFVYNPAVGTFE